MSCWHYPYAEYNTCWRCDYVRDFNDSFRVSPIFITLFVVIVIVLALL